MLHRVLPPADRRPAPLFGRRCEGCAEPGDDQPHGDPARHARAVDDLTSTTRASSPSSCSRNRFDARRSYAGLYLGSRCRPSAGSLSASGCRSPCACGPTGRRSARVIALLLVGAAFTFAFTAIAFCIALRAEDRLRGVGVRARRLAARVGAVRRPRARSPSRCSPTIRSSGRCSR